MESTVPAITFVESNGAEHRVQAELGQSVMQAAVNNQVPGILADCGGSCSCATCHGYIDADWHERVPQPEQAETDMLSCALDPLPTSRLTCQIKVTPELDGLVVRLPVSQI